MNFETQGRILYVSMVDVSQPNGPGVNEREFLQSLYDRLGDRMHAVLPRPRRACEEIDVRRTTLYFNPNRWNVVGFLWQQLQLYLMVRRLTRGNRFDLIVARLSLLPLAFLALSRREVPFAIKTLGEVQGFTANRGLKGLIAKALGPINAWLFRKIVPRAVAVDCCTDTHYRDHLNDYAISQERLTVIENATNVKRFYPRDSRVAKTSVGLARFSPVLGFVGGTPAERGGMQMLDVAAELISDYPDLGVVIVGHDKGGVLRQRVKELGLSECAAIPGLVPYETIPNYVNSFDVGFALDRAERMLTTGNSYQKVRQYLACGKPVITCVDEQSELIHEELVESVEPHDVSSLAQATRKLLDRNPEDRLSHVTRATQFVQERLSTDFTLRQRIEFWAQRLGS